MRVLFACITYGPLEPQALRSQRAAIMHAARHGVTWVGDLSPDRLKFDAARNTVAAGAIEMGDVDAVFWCDSDVVLPTDAISRLVLEQKDFITGIYCQRYPPHFPLIAGFSAERCTFNWIVEWPPDAVAPIDGCGFGCVLTSTALLKAIAPPTTADKPWFAFEQYSEDFDFCLKAAAAGFQLFVHTGVLCGHLADPQPIGVADFLRVREAGGVGDGAVRSDAA